MRKFLVNLFAILLVGGGLLFLGDHHTLSVIAAATPAQEASVLIANQTSQTAPVNSTKRQKVDHLTRDVNIQVPTGITLVDALETEMAPRGLRSTTALLALLLSQGATFNSAQVTRQNISTTSGGRLYIPAGNTWLSKVATTARGSRPSGSRKPAQANGGRGGFANNPNLTPEALTAASIKGLETRLQELKDAFDKQKSTLTAAQAEVTRLEQENKRLQGIIDQQNNNAGWGAWLRRLSSTEYVQGFVLLLAVIGLALILRLVMQNFGWVSYLPKPVISVLCGILHVEPQQQTGQATTSPWPWHHQLEESKPVWFTTFPTNPAAMKFWVGSLTLEITALLREFPEFRKWVSTKSSTLSSARITSIYQRVQLLLSTPEVRAEFERLYGDPTVDSWDPAVLDKFEQPVQPELFASSPAVPAFSDKVTAEFSTPALAEESATPIENHDTEQEPIELPAAPVTTAQGKPAHGTQRLTLRDVGNLNGVANELNPDAGEVLPFEYNDGAPVPAELRPGLDPKQVHGPGIRLVSTDQRIVDREDKRPA